LHRPTPQVVVVPAAGPAGHLDRVEGHLGAHIDGGFPNVADTVSARQLQGSFVGNLSVSRVAWETDIERREPATFGLGTAQGP